MITNYLKIAIRSLMRFKGYAIINLLGLALGLTAGILIILYVIDEVSYDKFHSKLDRIYRVESQFVSDNSSADEAGTMETNGWGVGHVLRNNFAEVEAVLYMRGAHMLINYGGKNISQTMQFASPEFFTIFSFPLKKGNAATALVEPYSVVISESMEEKYFHGKDALNQTLVMQDTMHFVVTGVMDDLPSNSHIQLDMLISFSTFASLISPPFNYDQGWGNINMRNYILLKEGVDVEHFKAKAKNVYTERAPGMLADWGVEANVVFMPLKHLYLTARANGLGPLGSKDRLYLVSGIAGFVVLLACINFINLTTARSVYRAKEVGLRKLAGSKRGHLMGQFLCEAFMLTLMALIIAIAFAGLLFSLFNQLIAKNYSLASLLNPSVLLGMAGLLVVVALLAGFYPSWVMSGMLPAKILKGKIQNSSTGIQLRRALVVFQFVISISLVLGTLIVIDQLNYMQRQDLGFNKSQVFVINASVRPANRNIFATFKEQLESLAIVEDVTFTSSLPGHPGWQGQIAYPEGRSGDEAVSVEYMAIDEDYVKTLGLQLIEGRGFDEDHEAELKEGLILNETAVFMFGWQSPSEAIGKKITSPSGYPEGEVIGVVKDYHQFGLQQKIGPIVMGYNPSVSRYLYAVRYKAANTRELISAANELWQKSFGDHDFNYFFLDESFERQYQSERRLARALALFAVATIFVALIGLLGLVSFMVAARTKEIGVRKVLGADVLQISYLLSKEFLWLVIGANVITFPIIWSLAERWLQNFAKRDDLDPLMFVITALVAVTITLVTISFQSVKAAMMDPVKSLRYE